MKVNDLVYLIQNLSKTETDKALDDVMGAIREVVWPPDSDSFLIYPESGKKRNEGNGVRAIKEGFVEGLVSRGWDAERPFPLQDRSLGVRLGPMDAAKTSETLGIDYCVEWETGNISSSHRAMNKLSLGLLRGAIAVGILVLPTQNLARFLTDRIGNFRELSPYFPLWESIQAPSGSLIVISVEHDGESDQVPRIPKMTDGLHLY